MAADDLEAGRMVDERRRLMLEQGSSLGGARPKCTVQLDGELWLAKLPSRNDRINMPRLEFGTLRLAVRCGGRLFSGDEHRSPGPSCRARQSPERRGDVQSQAG